MDGRLFIQATLCMATVVDPCISTYPFQVGIGGICPSLAPEDKLFIAVPGEEAFKAMKVIFAAEESNRTGKVVEIDQQ